MKKTEPATCDGCGHVWPRDPVLEVPCSVCGAKVGQACRTRRPSEHVHSAAFSNLPPWGHDTRELLAAAENKYGCGCGISADEARRRLERLLRGEPAPQAELPLFARQA